MCTGWTYDQVGEQFDVPRLNAMQSYWEGSPPIHIMIKTYLGIKPKEKGSAENAGLLEALAAFNQG